MGKRLLVFIKRHLSILLKDSPMISPVHYLILPVTLSVGCRLRERRKRRRRSGLYQKGRRGKKAIHFNWLIACQGADIVDSSQRKEERDWSYFSKGRVFFEKYGKLYHEALWKEERNDFFFRRPIIREMRMGEAWSHYSLFFFLLLTCLTSFD